LYKALCSIVLNHGSPGDSSNLSVCCLSLSQLRPLLERHWQANFDESSLSFRNEEGSLVRMKKMKHLLQQLLRWREQRRAWQQTKGLPPAAVDKALDPKLELVPCKKQHDLMLCCSALEEPINFAPRAPSSSEQHEHTIAIPEGEHGAGVGNLRSEVERLRVENQELRAKNLQLRESGSPAPKAMGSSPTAAGAVSSGKLVGLRADIFDDPFEPPPEMHPWMQEHCILTREPSSDFSSTDVGSEVHYSATSTTLNAASLSGWHSQCASTNASGAITPVCHPPVAQTSCTFLPMWYPFMQSASNCFVDVSVIPRGIVQSAREQFERIAMQ